MTVRATYQIDEKAIEDMELSITIRMRVSEWRALVSRLPGGYEVNLLVIGQAIATALGDLKSATEREYSFNDAPR